MPEAQAPADAYYWMSKQFHPRYFVEPPPDDGVCFKVWTTVDHAATFWAVAYSDAARLHERLKALSRRLSLSRPGYTIQHVTTPYTQGRVTTW